MRPRMMALLVLGAMALAGSLAGCPAAHDDYPGTACMSDNDCYQGEVCKDHTICVPNIDMSVIGDFAHPPLPSDGGGDKDLMPSDMTPDDL
jgi:hypothetical protein